jgi:hypothetical protein
MGFSINKNFNIDIFKNFDLGYFVLNLYVYTLGFIGSSGIILFISSFFNENKKFVIDYRENLFYYYLLILSILFVSYIINSFINNKNIYIKLFIITLISFIFLFRLTVINFNLLSPAVTYILYLKLGGKL